MNDEITILEDEKVELPQKYTRYKISSKHILIAPNYPSWIILNENEYQMFLFLEKMNLKEALENYEMKFDTKAENLRNKLLEIIFNHNFYKDGYKNTSDEDDIKTIQKNIHINLTNDCNMRCKHCFVNAGRVEKKYVNIEKIIQKINEITKINGFTEVVISGGEPLLHKEIFKLLSALKGHKITLFTNGILINNKNIEKIAEFVSEIQISFEGVSPEIYENNRGKNNYKKVLNAINLIKSKNIKLILAITILPDTLSDIKQNLLNFIKKIDYSNLEIRLNNEIELIGAAPKELNLKNYNKKLSDKIIYELMKELLNLGIAKTKTKEQNIRFKNCGIGTSIVIDANGKIYPCSKFGSFYLNLDESAEKIMDKFDNINRQTCVNFMEKCKKCDLKFICCGGCKIDNLNLKNNMRNAICDRKYKQNILRGLIDEWEANLV
ncbi:MULTISPECIES: radical SAM/SPASM domain-containing protein [unclassified Campylobacter]|uniref:radical SAM/SPASM domain-containing protein n=1 Tax=unclassified Campylobacter TaxID=2593542 RepID=UPI0022E9A094|nr:MULTISPECIES: radical SAM protein [unclassified Campylobacter]MDA3043839.1 radical SAM protein [Campylobacter sp. JMF_09 ED2]MDA3043988.1 radical SAM protein [Campylobacter sp. JMF_07 ED4]MDA3064077.1 radical SAM protein [Campylobacter sp. JMF_11 EL3]MDA3072323.1 radical SAM protein [Campylobacter sp. VBCF_03 NA9]MDA3074892.1 radical SAM protein [Campylobacter sp. JMF_05 ED3]